MASVPSRSPPKEVAEARPAEPAPAATSGTAKGAFWATQYAQAANADEQPAKAAAARVKSTSPPPVASRYSPPKKNGSSPPRMMSGVVEHRLEGVVKVEVTPAAAGRQQQQHSHRYADAEVDHHHDDRGSKQQQQESSFAAFEPPEYRVNEQLKDEIDRLNGALKQALSEKSAIASKFEKLTTICRSQRQEIHDLKSALNSRIPSVQQQQLNFSSSHAKASQTLDQGSDSQSGTIWDLQDGLSTNSTNQQTSWAAFEEQTPPKQQSSTFSSSSSQVNVRASMDSMFGSTPGKNSMRHQDVRSSTPGGESRNNLASQERSSKPYNSSFPSPNNNNKPADTSSRVQPAGWAGF